MRICTKCKVSEPRNKSSSYCVNCFNNYQKNYYKEHSDRIKQTAIKRRSFIREYIIKEKNKPCMDCKKQYPYYVMDFDHVRGEKKFNLSIAGRWLPNIQTIIDEIKKCDIVCSNCHRERTFNRNGLFE